MIPDFKTYLKESHWSDMNRRSQGITVRKEDDVNLMDDEAFLNYLEDHYEIENNYEDYEGNFMMVEDEFKLIGVPIYSYKGDPVYLFKIFYPETVVQIHDSMEQEYPELFKKICNKYLVSLYDDEDKCYLKIEPRDGREIDNKFYLNVLTFILSNVEVKGDINQKLRRIKI
jgi:hypothetical protein